MHPISLSSPQRLVTVSGNVVNATAAFASRYCAENSYVLHPTHGQGFMRKRFGNWCVVDFQTKVSKRPEELSEEELNSVDDIDELMCVTWITTAAHRIHISELRPMPAGVLSHDWKACHGFPASVTYD